ncbi:winged helix-turn-helix domain-containing protein [Halobacteriales archaeon Cl-PHB]
MDEETAGDERVAVERRSPDDVFALLGNDVRVDILRALGQAPDEGVSFSTLFDRVDLADSGNFTYHLEKLRGTFVRKDGDYELTYAGRQIVGAIHAGTYTADASVAPFHVGWDCQLCGGEMTVAYRDELATIECEACGEGLRFPFPPGSLDQYERRDLPGAFARWYHHGVTRLLDGFCSVCAGRLEGALRRPPGEAAGSPRPSVAEFECGRCGHVATLTGAPIASGHPVVRAFFVDHGFDPTARHPSQIWGDLDDSTTEVLERDPLRLAVRFANAGEAVRVVVEPDASVGDVTRTHRDE